MKLNSFIENKDLTNINELNTPVLGTFSGVFAKLDSMSVNKRWYSSKFWKSVLSKDYVKQALDNGSMLGTLEHPNVGTDFTKDGQVTSRHPSQSSHIVKELKIVGDEVIGKAYILNNSMGRALVSLLLATDENKVPLVNMHVSARGFSEHDYFDQNGIDQMNPDDYFLRTFDVVVNPGIKGTRIKYESDGSNDHNFINTDPSIIDNAMLPIHESVSIANKLRSELNLKST
jgi:hypothetical protein